LKSLRFAVAVLAALGTCSLTLAEETDTESSQLMSNLNVQVSLLEGQDYTIVHALVDRLEEGQSYEEERTLYAGNDYKIIGLGGPGVKDFDMYVYNSDDDVVDKDLDTTNVPILTFHISETGQYKIKSKLYKVQAGTDEDKECLFSYVMGWKRED
jgi:hypothetical protein